MSVAELIRMPVWAQIALTLTLMNTRRQRRLHLDIDALVSVRTGIIKVLRTRGKIRLKHVWTHAKPLPTILVLTRTPMPVLHRTVSTRAGTAIILRLYRPVIDAYANVRTGRTKASPMLARIPPTHASMHASLCRGVPATVLTRMPVEKRNAPILTPTSTKHDDFFLIRIL
jgi:hypothetical protein